MDEFAIATIRKCFPEVTTNRTESEVKHMVEKWYRWKLMMKHKLCRRWTDEEKVAYVDGNMISRNMVMEVYISQWKENETALSRAEMAIYVLDSLELTEERWDKVIKHLDSTVEDETHILMKMFQLKDDDELSEESTTVQLSIEKNIGEQPIDLRQFITNHTNITNRISGPNQRSNNNNSIIPIRRNTISRQYKSQSTTSIITSNTSNDIARNNINKRSKQRFK